MFLAKAGNDEILAAVDAMEVREEECLMLLIGEKNGPDIQLLIDQLQHKELTFFGGIFPGIIDGEMRSEEGVILKRFQFIQPPTLVRNLSEGQLSEIDAMDVPPADQQFTTIILLDGLTSGLNLFLERMNNRLGDRVSFLGAGAGSMSLVQQPCIFNNEGFFQDAAVCCTLHEPIVLGVRHGWEHLMGPLVATRTKGNVIYELNWENAFDIYKNAVEQDCGCTLEADNFFNIAKGYPLGILREGAEDIVRDPLSVGEQGELICIGEVPSNTVLHILKGDPERLIDSARMVAEDCLKQLEPDAPIGHTLVVDCISRTFFLEDEFSSELRAIQQQIPEGAGERQAQGVLSLGEISSYGTGTLELFNKTIVVGLLKSIS